MIVYRSAERQEAPDEMTAGLVDAAAAVARAADASAAGESGRGDPVDWWTERLVEAGELEAAVLDAVHVERDGMAPIAAPLRRLTRAAARGLAVAHA
ncbi:MAG TPA: hypothetical protein VGD56_01920, partial [Gemmatirosa sp.]